MRITIKFTTKAAVSRWFFIVNLIENLIGLPGEFTADEDHD